ncbi:GNAT family N-acetyltransferase [Cellulomonas bogoriensis]|uniref:Lysine N-acyltransferase MbtK n=1 Tax=Cellulomonas bogoriensis 69B4 = DSM 16987 TaxID=1386082 RepID=A0A0A0BXF8_9CELL|nr:GNAT family N-acetyltransferase [Cellulomonas bogoriensis]KGM12601.1 acetyltransferase [Cellulomonas bogoriensis 69B4 = DSM 16987]
MSTVTTVGALTTRPVDLDADVPVVHAWVTTDRARFWGMRHATVQDVRDDLAATLADPHRDARTGLHDGVPAFLLETYDPTHHELAQQVPVGPGDLGMHLLVGTPVVPLRGFTLAVMRTVMAHCFADPGVRRVVVEPDVRNHRIHALNEAVGFVVDREVALSDKRALISVCTRTAFESRTR